MAEKDITKRILETKRQAEELKAQLQTLINTGRNFVDSGFSSGIAQSHNNSSNENIVTSPNKVQIVKSFNINHSKPVIKPPTSINAPTNKNENELPTKVRHYKREEAREYMKKQREKRVEQSKNQEAEKLKAELQKKKLEELHKKTKELVCKNIQAKRERSNSRDKNVYLRPDESTRNPESRSRSRGREPVTGATWKTISTRSKIPVEEKNPNLLHPPPQKYTLRHGNKKINTEVLDGQRSTNINIVSNVTLLSPKELALKDDQQSNNINVPNITSRSPKEQVLKDNQQSNEINVLSNITLRSPKEQTLKVSLDDHNVLSKITVRSSKEQVSKESLDDKKINVISNTILRSPLKPQIFGADLEKTSRPVSSEKRTKECPNWLQEQPAQGYPFNFINTVKRQLQFVTNSPKPSVDIGIQSSLRHAITIPPNPEQVKTKQQLKDTILESASTKSDLKSFMSHKCLNLDPRRIDHLELVQNTVTRISGTESESDTSKNIPEISSESGTSLKNNAESVRRNLDSQFSLAIDTDKLSNMKLVSHTIKSATTTIRSNIEKNSTEPDLVLKNTLPNYSQLSPSINRVRETSGYSLSVDDEYDSDFHTDLSRSRESIIAFNSPTYQKQVALIPGESVESGSSVTRESQLLQKNPVAKSTPREDILEEVSSEKVQSSIEQHSTNIPSTISTGDSSSSRESRGSTKTKSKKSKSSLAFNSLLSELHPSRTIAENLSKSDGNLTFVNTKRGSGSTKKMSGLQNSTNELHLKFEAEIHLLSDFNASLQQFAAVEKALETLKSSNELTTSKILHNQDTQTSARPKSSTASKISDPPVSEKAVSEVATINYSRGSFIDSVIEEDTSNVLGSSVLKGENDSIMSIGLDVSTFNHSETNQPIQNNNFAGMSLGMFEQLIKDEDARLDNLKAILKIREQVLLDRTKGELAWLEIQRKHFKETGQLHEASVIKKKQRGILVNHQKEKYEMQRMKQMQKAASVERKIVLKEQRNMIRQQLSTDNMLKKIKVNTPRERRQSGPIKVIQRHSESIHSETSHRSTVSRVSEISRTEVSIKETVSETESTHQLSHVKRTLLMRETALKKRKKLAEDLLQWHEKLQEEEKRIAELESTASTIISQKPSSGEKYRFKGKQLNQLWYNLTGCEGKKFLEEKVYPMSQISLERFCKDAREYSTKPIKKVSDNETEHSVSENIPEREETETTSVQTESQKNEYTSDFDVESVLSNEEVEILDQSINQLITNFSKIKEDISAFGSKQLKKSEEDPSDSEIEISVIETNKDTTGQESSSKIITTEEHNIQNSVVESLNDSKEILLMLGPTQDILTQLDRVINDSEAVEELSREVRNSLSTTENILSTLSQAQEKSSTKQSEDKIVTDKHESLSSKENAEGKAERSSNITSLLSEEKAADVSEKLSSKLASLAPPTEDTEQLSSKHKSVSSKECIETAESKAGKSSIITSLLLEENTADVSEKIPYKLSIEEESTHAQETDKLSSKPKSVSSKEYVETAESKAERSSNITSLLSEENAADVSEKIASKLSNKKKPTHAEETDKLSSKPRSVSSKESVNTADSKAERSANITSLLSEENDADVSEQLSWKLSNKEPSHAEETDKSSSKPKSMSSKEFVETSESEAEISSNITSLLSEEKSAGVSEEIHFKLSNKEEPTRAEETNKLSSKLKSVSPKEFVETAESKADVSEKIMLNLTRVAPVEDSANINDFSENQTVSPDDEDLDETENTSSESLEQLLRISKAADVDNFEEKASYIDGSVILDFTAPEELATEEKTPEKYSFDESLKETNIDEDISSYIGRESSKEFHLDLSYGIIDKHSNEESLVSKEDVNVYEEKEQDSLSYSTTTSSTDKLGAVEKEDPDKSVLSGSFEESPKGGSIDVKKRVSEILADANQNSRGDKSPRMQDLYVTTYDLISPATSPEAGSPTNERKFINSIFGNEAEEILRKQLAIEQEIKAITEQQQKEQQIPHAYVREIPNKPPPPYTPPSSLPPVNYPTIVPNVQEIEEITKYSAKILHKAYVSHNLENISISENTLSLITKNVTKECYKFVFDLCKDISREHYGQFEEKECRSWMVPEKKARLTVVSPLDVNGLEALLNKKLKELFVYEKPNRRENTIIKWSRKKRDHVDEILVMESQAEEAQWTNYDKEELVVKDQITNEIWNMLLKDTGEALKACFERG